MSKKKAAWPINKGIFRTPFQTEFAHQRSPSPIVEMPLSPDPEASTQSNGHPPLQPLRINTSVERSMSPQRSMSPFSPTINNRVREIPIEVQQEVCDKNHVQTRNRWNNRRSDRQSCRWRTIFRAQWEQIKIPDDHSVDRFFLSFFFLMKSSADSEPELILDVGLGKSVCVCEMKMTRKI